MSYMPALFTSDYIQGNAFKSNVMMSEMGVVKGVDTLLYTHTEPERSVEDIYFFQGLIASHGF